MASFTCHQVRIPDDHMVVLSEMMRKKKVAKTPNVTITNKFKTYTEGSMLNRVKSNLTILNSHDYSGSVIGTYPPSIESNLSGGFSHEADNTTNPQGSKGAVVYCDYNDSQQECAWLLAWHTPIGGSECKVYVECGEVAQYKPDTLSWDVVERNLDVSLTKSYFKDNLTGTESSAQIDFSGDIGDLAAYFKVSN